MSSGVGVGFVARVAVLGVRLFSTVEGGWGFFAADDPCELGGVLLATVAFMGRGAFEAVEGMSSVVE